MQNALLLLVILLTCALANVCHNNGAGGSIFVCHNGSLDDLRYVPRSLSLVNCSINEVESFAFEGLSLLESLNLSRNAITRIRGNAFSGLKSLNKLDLTFNMIESIDDGSFFNVSNIRLLDLRYNNLTRIENAVLRPLSRASTLDIRFNKLRCSSSQIFNDTALKWFYIGNNPWNKKCWANLTRCLYNAGIYYGKNQAFDSLREDRLIWKAFYKEAREILSEEQAEQKANILKEAEGWKKYYESAIQEIADERERLEDLIVTTEEIKKSEGLTDDEEHTDTGIIHYGRAFIVWILTVCKIFPIN